jgi:hypothetical protein
MAWTDYDLGAALAKLRNRIRAGYAELYGVCRVCQEPMGGPSPEQICTDCHAGEAAAMAFGGGGGGEA